MCPSLPQCAHPTVLHASISKTTGTNSYCHYSVGNEWQMNDI